MYVSSLTRFPIHCFLSPPYTFSLSSLSSTERHRSSSVSDRHLEDPAARRSSDPPPVQLSHVDDARTSAAASSASRSRS
ncbi:extensin-like [Iris pallida]|uniref:Extensin-like n=1 Tax=Iris pallida TaxID=29817 RepID=A0AAX6EQA8_IRIPA|nr:extensin-like [Iris pallida]KAJ6834315.1 extensin-like [Iris pallida]